MSPPSTRPPERRLLGIALRITSATLLAGMAACAKLASARGVTVPELLFYRSVFALPLAAGWIGVVPGWAAVRTRRPRAHVTRTLVGFTAMGMMLGSISRLPLGEATTIIYLSPLIATLLSAALLRERIGRHRWAAVLAGFVGILVVVRPGAAGLATAGVLLGLGGALGQAAVMITLRQLGRTENTAAIVWWFLVLSSLLGAAFLPLFGRWHGGAVLVTLAGCGLFAGAGQIAMTASLRFAPVATVAPFDYLQILWATLFGWLVFAAPLDPATLAGAALIAGSGLYTAYRERLRGREPVEALAPPET